MPSVVRLRVFFQMSELYLSPPAGDMFPAAAYPRFASRATSRPDQGAFCPVSLPQCYSFRCQNYQQQSAILDAKSSNASAPALGARRATANIERPSRSFIMLETETAERQLRRMNVGLFHFSSHVFKETCLLTGNVPSRRNAYGTDRIQNLAPSFL
jgi:hypothetical protein